MICVAKTKALISFAVTAKLICVCVFSHAKSRFSHDPAHIIKHFPFSECLIFLKGSELPLATAYTSGDLPRKIHHI